MTQPQEKTPEIRTFEQPGSAHTVTAMPYLTAEERLQQQQVLSYISYHSTACNYPSRRTNFIWSYVADWLFILVIAVCCAIWFAAKPDKIFFRLDDPSLWYPNKSRDTFPSWLLQLLVWGAPFLIFALAQIWLRSWPEYHATMLAFIEAVLMSYFVTTFLMWAVGGLRPSFLSECLPQANPVVTSEGNTGGANPYNWYTDYVCTGDSDTVRTAQQSFPSGHAAVIFASWGFLVLYLNAKIKPFDGFAHAWKLVIFFPLTLAVWISFSRVNDGKHTQFDVCAGIVVGLVIALIAYRFNFCSITGPTNHIPVRMTWTIDHTYGGGRLGGDFSQQTREMYLAGKGHSMVYTASETTNGIHQAGYRPPVGRPTN